MSIEDLKKFGQLCNDDLEVRDRAKEIGLTDTDGLIAYGRELGLEFTGQDMLDLAREAGIHSDELSEEDLERIAGGVCTVTAAAVAAGAVCVAGVVAAAGGTAVAATAMSAMLCSAATCDKW